MSNREKIIARAQKLLNLASKAGTEGEALAAMGAVQRLITQHKLSESELEVKAKDEFSMNPTYILGVMSRWPGWLTTLAFDLANQIDCRCTVVRTRLPSGKKACTYGIAGSDEDAQMVFVMFGYIKAQINKFGAFYRLDGHNTHKVNAYKLGMVRRVIELMAEEKKKAEANAPGLVVMNDKIARIDQWLKDVHGFRTKSITTGTRNGDALNAGSKDASRVGLGNKARLNRGQRALNAG